MSDGEDDRRRRRAGYGSQLLGKGEHGPTIVDGSGFFVFGVGQGSGGYEVGADYGVGPGLEGRVCSLQSVFESQPTVVFMMYS